MLRILLVEERSPELVFGSDSVPIRLELPHYCALPPIGALEGGLTRAERIGFRTTPVGTRRLPARIETQYRAEAEALLGRNPYAPFVERIG